MYNDKKIGLALSGGGYRAAAFHLGTLKALHRLGVLPKIDVISSVSGGSIIAAYYLLHQSENFSMFEQRFRKKLQISSMRWIYAELIGLCCILLSVGYYCWALSVVLLIVLLIAFFIKSFYVIPINFLIQCQYKKLFFGNKSVKDLPKHPILAINSTDTEYGKPFVFTRDRIIHSEYQPVDGHLIFNPSKISLAKAVMASSCIPLFNPVRIGGRSQNVKLGKSVYLMDGGLFDNEGIHRLVHSHGKTHADFNIISNAGNTRWDAESITNMFSSLYKGINIMMKRTQSMQNQQLMYDGQDGSQRFAFFQLDWDNTDQAFLSFIKYMRQHVLPQELMDYHHLKIEDLNDIHSNECDIRKSAEMRIIEKLKANIYWDSLRKQMPTDKERTVAVAVKTRLDGLTPQQIDALMSQANWLTELQIRLYLPELIS